MKRSINTLISEVTSIICAYAFDAEGGEDEHWITLSNGSRVLINGNGDILAGMGGKFSGQKIRDIKDPDEQLNERESVSNALFGEKPARKQYHRIKADFEQKERVERLKRQEQAKQEKEKEEAAREKSASDLVADTIDKESYGGYDMHKSDRELNAEAYDKYNGDEKKVHAEQLKISKQRDKYVDDNVKMFEKVGSEHGWEGTDVSRSRQSMSTYVTLQKEGYDSVEIRFSDHEDRHFANAINLMTGNSAKENKQRLSAFLEKQRPLGQDSARNVQHLIAECHKIIDAYAADAGGGAENE